MKKENNEQNMLKIGEFISVASQLAYSACEIIKEASQNKDLKKYNKGFNDPVTEADYHVQTMIINGLSKFFPKLKIIGEETVDYQGKIKIDYEKISMNFGPEHAKFNNIQVPYSELCVWIDPIDCTSGFIKGKMEYVTSLIGMSRNKKAYAGIVAMPFKKVKENAQYLPTVSIGVVQTQEAFVYNSQNNGLWSPLVKTSLHNPPLITTSRNRVNKLFQGLTNYLMGKNVFSGGAGKKIMMVVDGSADLLAYVSTYTSKWDTCAGEAIVLAMGGYFVSQDNEPIVYDPDAQNYDNTDGQICTVHKEVLEKVFEFFGNENKK